MSIFSRQSPPPPPHGVRSVLSARKGIRVFAALFAAALFFASCDQPTDSGNGGSTASGGSGDGGGGGKTGGNGGSGSKPRFTLTKTGSTYRLTVSDGVTAVKDNEFNSSSTIITAKAGAGLPAAAVVSEIKLPGSLRSIGNGGFKDNQGVTGTLTLPSSLQSIGSSAFGNLGKNHSQAGSAGNSNKAPVIDFGSGSTLKSIGESAFAGGRLRSLALPGSLETIGASAFEGVTLSGGGTSPGGASPGTLVIPGGVSKIGARAFSGLKGVSTVRIESTGLAKPAGAVKPFPLEPNIFQGTGITSVTLPVEVYSSYTSAERNEIFGTSVIYSKLDGPLDAYIFTLKADNTYKLTVKEGVTAIPANEFSVKFDLASSRLKASPIIQRYATISGERPTILISEIQLPSTLKTIGNFAFHRNLSVRGNFTIPGNVETIGDDAFTFLGASYGGTAAPSRPAITFESGSRLKTVGRRAFAVARSSSALVLPNGLETIGAEAFRDFIMPSSPLVIPASVRKIGDRAFRSFDGITGFTINSVNLTYDAADPRLGSDLFGSGANRKSTITSIKLPPAVYSSYPNRAALTAIFGTEITAAPNGYQDLSGTPHP